jgi:hypothetical protein
MTMMRTATGSSQILEMSIQRASCGTVVIRMVPGTDAKLEDIGVRSNVLFRVGFPHAGIII